MRLVHNELQRLLLYVVEDLFESRKKEYHAISSPWAGWGHINPYDMDLEELFIERCLVRGFRKGREPQGDEGRRTARQRR